jgi:hypothetical protein
LPTERGKLAAAIIEEITQVEKVFSAESLDKPLALVKYVPAAVQRFRVRGVGGQRPEMLALKKANPRWDVSVDWHRDVFLHRSVCYATAAGHTVQAGKIVSRAAEASSGEDDLRLPRRAARHCEIPEARRSKSCVTLCEGLPSRWQDRPPSRHSNGSSKVQRIATPHRFDLRGSLRIPFMSAMTGPRVSLRLSRWQGC